MVKCLLSIRTTGSISVEHVTEVAAKERNHLLGTDKRAAAARLLLRVVVGLNMCLKNESLRAAKAALGKVDWDDA